MDFRFRIEDFRLKNVEIANLKDLRGPGFPDNASGVLYKDLGGLIERTPMGASRRAPTVMGERTSPSGERTSPLQECCGQPPLGAPAVMGAPPVRPYVCNDK